MTLFKTSHRLFLILMLIKWVDGIIQFWIGIVAIFISQHTLYNFVWGYLQGELIEDQNAWFTQYLLNSLQGLTLSTQHFIAFYLISHGVIKSIIVYNIFKKKYWAYPVAITVFSLFTLYQTYLYINSGSLWMMGLIIMDIIIVILTYFEYKNVTNHKAI